MAGKRAEGAPAVEMVGERRTVATLRHGSPDLKGTVDMAVSTKAFTNAVSHIAVHLQIRCSICLPYTHIYLNKCE